MAKKFTDDLKKELRDLFVHGYLDENNKRQFPTIDQLSSQFDVSRATLYRFSNKNDWQQQKNNLLIYLYYQKSGNISDISPN